MESSRESERGRSSFRLPIQEASGALIEPDDDGTVSIASFRDEMKVKVIAIDDQDRVRLSRKAALREMATAQKGDSAKRPKQTDVSR